MPGNSLHVTAVSDYEVDAAYEERNYSKQPQRKKIFIIRDSHLIRIKKGGKSKDINYILYVLVEQILSSWIIIWYQY